MMHKYSPSTNCFYVVGLHINIPPDARDVTPALYEAIMNGSGKWTSDENGDPVELQPEAVVFTLEQLAKSAIAKVNTEYTKRMDAIAEAYPVHERESWPVQLQEANLLLSYAGLPIPDSVKTPWIDQCAHQRGLDRMELAGRIVAKDEGYRTVSGFLSGVRQWHEDCIDMLLQDGEDAREALQGYDHLQGWEQSAPV